MPRPLFRHEDRENGVECFVFAIPKLLRRDLALVFPDQILSDDTFLILLLFRSECELCVPSQLANEEKDRLFSRVRFPLLPVSSSSLSLSTSFRCSERENKVCLPSNDQFVALATRLREDLLPLGHWLEAVDPASGVPVSHSESNRMMRCEEWNEM